MDLLKATNLELYDIAKDEGARMKDRYAAAIELQNRKKERELNGTREDLDNDRGGTVVLYC